MFAFRNLSEIMPCQSVVYTLLNQYFLDTNIIIIIIISNFEVQNYIVEYKPLSTMCNKFWTVHLVFNKNITNKHTKHVIVCSIFSFRIRCIPFVYFHFLFSHYQSETRITNEKCRINIDHPIKNLLSFAL